MPHRKQQKESLFWYVFSLAQKTTHLSNFQDRLTRP